MFAIRDLVFGNGIERQRPHHDPQPMGRPWARRIIEIIAGFTDRHHQSEAGWPFSKPIPKILLQVLVYYRIRNFGVQNAVDGLPSEANPATRLVAPSDNERVDSVIFRAQITHRRADIGRLGHRELGVVVLIRKPDRAGVRADRFSRIGIA